MAAPIVKIPQPSKDSYNPNRPLSKNTLLANQVRHFIEIEKKLPREKQTGMDHKLIETELQASEYVERMTAILHPAGARTGRPK
jgi:hypothetical protein